MHADICWHVSQVRIMKKRLVRKTFDMVEEIANREEKNVSVKTIWPNKWSVCFLDLPSDNKRFILISCGAGL